MLLSYLINVYKSFYLVYLLILVRPFCFADYIAKVISKGINPGELVLLNSCFIVGVLLRIAYTLTKSPLSKAFICKSYSFSKLVCKEV
jgi:hypothetical protein